MLFKVIVRIMKFERIIKLMGRMMGRMIIVRMIDKGEDDKIGVNVEKSRELARWTKIVSII